MTHLSRRRLLQSAAALGLSAATGAQAQGNWPDHPIRIIVPYPAGGSTDVLIRILGEKMKDILGQPIIVENRPGAGGNVGIAAVAQSAPDGYTIGAGTVGHFAINQFLYTKMPFDPEKDIVAPTLTWELPNVFVVPADHVPAKSVQEFVAWAKQKGSVTYGSPGVGTSPHLSGVMFVQRYGLNATHVPFRGAAQTIPAMLAGDVNFAIDNLASYVPSIDSGKMRALAVTSAVRWSTLQQVPTMAEAGVKDFVVTSWGALVVPAATPRPIVDKLSETMKKLDGDHEIRKRFLLAGARTLSSTPAAAAAYIAKERAMWKAVVIASGAKAD
jgi:tripartite-type tricarboxylate transporter receptor subunit TctC